MNFLSGSISIGAGRILSGCFPHVLPLSLSRFSYSGGPERESEAIIGDVVKMLSYLLTELYCFTNMCTMPRHSRIDYHGALHHVIVRGINRSPIFKDDDDRREFLRRLQVGIEKTQLTCYAWALIPNHVHLLLQTGPTPLSTLMRSLLTGYAVYFNLRHKRVGHLFQNRYKSILCDKESYFLQLIRYIHLNPFRAGLVKDIRELNLFPWCGHSILVSKQSASWQDKKATLSHFGSTSHRARKKYIEFVIKGIPQGRRSDLTGGGLIRSAGGWHNLLELRKMGERMWGDERILGDSDFVRHVLLEAGDKLTQKERHKQSGWSLDLLLETISEIFHIDSSSIQEKKRDSTTSKARSLFCWWATNNLGFTLAAVAEFLQLSRSAVFQARKNGEQVAREEKVIFPSE